MFVAVHGVVVGEAQRDGGAFRTPSTLTTRGGRPWHGCGPTAGAGQHGRQDEGAYRQACAAACEGAWRALSAGATSVAAAEAAIRILEDDPVTNAGVGSNLTEDGVVEVDASMMEAHTGAFGAVGAVPGVRNPAAVARALLEQGRRRELSLRRLPPMMLCGDGARRWAQQHRLAVVDPASLLTGPAERTRAQHARYRRALDALPADDLDVPVSDGLARGLPVTLWDTVGAVCVDAAGHLAAGVSSGGIALKAPGRVGEAAVFGAGCWAAVGPDVSVGTSTTGGPAAFAGMGEQVIRTLLAKTCAEALLSQEASAASSAALEHAMQTDFLDAPTLAADRVRQAGVLAVVARGRAIEVLWAHTTPSMVVAFQGDAAAAPTVTISRQPRFASDSAGHALLVVGGWQSRSSFVSPLKRPRPSPS